jgi:hypothetical protein
MKLRSTHTSPNGATTQKTAIFVLIALATLNPTSHNHFLADQHTREITLLRFQSHHQTGTKLCSSGDCKAHEKGDDVVYIMTTLQAYRTAKQLNVDYNIQAISDL